jgi:hypothetical protein
MVELIVVIVVGMCFLGAIMEELEYQDIQRRKINKKE